MRVPLCIALALCCALAVLTEVGAVKTSSATHATNLAHAMKSKRSRMTGAGNDEEVLANLRGATNDASQSNDEGEDSDDDDEDDDDKTPVSVPAVAKPVHMKVSAKTLAASAALYDGAKDSNEENGAEEKKEKAEAAEAAEAAAEKEEKEKEEAEAAYNSAKRKQGKAEKEIKYFQDDEAFESKIAEETRLMTNETQSPALASFLGALRSEMRQYAMPAYPAYLQGKLAVADQKVKTLEAELDKETKEAGTKEKKVEAKSEDAKSTAKMPQAAAKKSEKVTAEAKTNVEPAVEADAKEVAQKAGETFAISFFANIAMLSVVFGMASAKDDTVKNYTWFLIDQVVAIFLAVMYFQAFDSLLNFHGMGAQYAVLCSILHAVCMLALVLGIAIALRKQQVALAVFCGAGAHLVSFSSIHAAASSQVYFVGMSYTYTMCIFGIGVLGLALALIGYLVFTSKKRMNLTEDDVFMDKTDDLENDFAAMAFSVVFTMFMRFLLTGHHPKDDDTEFDHSKEQRTAMFFYGIACLIVAGFAVNICSKKVADPNATYATKRVLNFVTSVVTMNVAWAWLYWGEWEFFEALFPGEAVKGRVMFAITMTTLGLLGLYGLSKIKDTSKASAASKKVALTALSLVVAWSWELCFDAAVEDMCEGVSHPVGWKIASTLLLAAFVVPVYAIYMKPISSKAAEAIGA